MATRGCIAMIKGSRCSFPLTIIALMQLCYSPENVRLLYKSGVDLTNVISAQAG